MKINATSMSSIGTVQATNRPKETQKKALVSEADNVEVSDKAQAYQALLQKAKELPSVREERVQTLTGQIERGEFKVDAQKIAEKLFSTE